MPDEQAMFLMVKQDGKWYYIYHRDAVAVEGNHFHNGGEWITLEEDMHG